MDLLGHPLSLYITEPLLQSLKYLVLVAGDTAHLIVAWDNGLDHVKIEVFGDAENHSVYDTPKSFIFDTKDATGPGKVWDEGYHHLLLVLLQGKLYVSHHGWNELRHDGI